MPSYRFVFGAIKTFEITPANVDDCKPLEDLSLSANPDSVILADKWYVSEKLTQKLQTREQILLALKRKNVRQQYATITQGDIPQASTH